MYCKNCGKEVTEQAVICPNCGVQVGAFKETQTEPQSNGMATAGFICSFFIPLLGWVFGGIGLSRSKKRGDKGKNLSIAAIVISSVSFVLSLLMYL